MSKKILMSIILSTVYIASNPSKADFPESDLREGLKIGVKAGKLMIEGVQIITPRIGAVFVKAFHVAKNQHDKWSEKREMKKPVKVQHAGPTRTISHKDIDELDSN